MYSHKFKTIIGITLLWLLACLPLRFSQACGPGDYSFKGYAFLRTDLVQDNADLSPFLLRFENLYAELDTMQERGNLQEWQDIFCGLVKIPDLRKVIYESSIEELESLYTSVRSKNLPLDFRFSKNSFALYLQRKKCIETSRYLVFAKKCEPYVVKHRGWEEGKRDTVAMGSLIKIGLRDFQKTKSNYIRLRYAYQVIRLAHYAGQYERTLELYDYLLPKTDPVGPLEQLGGSILQYWIQGHRAGAMMAMGERIKAAYLYMQIFLHCPSKRSSAFRSFRIKTDEEWRACWLLCQDDEERAALYAIRATADEAKAVEEMKKIYELSPASEMLELLLMKEMKKLERDFLGLEFNDQKKNNKILHDIPRENAGLYLVQLQELVIKAVKEKHVRNLPLWKLALGYLEYLSGDFYAAGKTFAQLEFDKKTQPVLHEQLQLFRLILDVVNKEEVTPAFENEIYRLIIDNPLYKKYPDLPDFINDRLTVLYANNKRPGMAFRFQHSLRELHANPQLDVIDDLLEVCNREDRSLLEGMIVINKKGENIRSELLNIKGSYLLSQDEPEIAVESFRLIPPVEWDNYQYNPFIERLNDCVFCPLPDSIEYYNKVELVQEIFKLEYEARADYRNGATHLYALGVAFYNMSYFGQAWEVMDGYRSGANWYYQKNNIYPAYWAPYGNLEHVDVSMALGYFERAVELSNDPELTARAAFMAAKCEQKQYFFSPACDYNIYSNEIPKLPDDYQRNFTLLRDNYAGTNFYQEAIRECLYFRAFVREEETSR